MAASIAYRVLHSQELADMVLGHEISSEARKYVGDADDPAVLLKLVEAIRERYAEPESAGCDR